MPTPIQNRNFNVSGIGLRSEDEILLKALVNLTPAVGEQRWTYSGPLDANVMIVNTDAGEGLKYMESKPSVVVITLGKAVGGRPHLEQPIRNTQLREILGTILDTQPASPTPEPTRAEPKPDASALAQRLRKRLSTAGGPNEAAGSRSKADGAQPLEALQKKFHHKHRMQASSDGELLFVLLPETRQVLLKQRLDALYPAIRRAGGKLAWERISNSRYEQLSTELQPLPLNNLRWCCGINLSNGELMAEISQWPAYRLRHWPDFGTLPYRREYARIARHMMTRPANLQQLQTRGGIGKDEVVGFLNAAYLCDWLERAAAPADEPVKPPLARPGKAGLIGKLRNSLGM